MRTCLENCDRKVFATSPEELKAKSGQDIVARLKRIWYGLQDVVTFVKGIIPNCCEAQGKQIDDSQTLQFGAKRMKRRGSCTTRAPYLSQDDPRISEAVKSVAGDTLDSKTEKDYQRLKRLARYPIEYSIHSVNCSINVYVNTDLASCALTGTSTTRLVTMLGRHCVKHQEKANGFAE